MAMDVLREARTLEAQGRRVIHMELGEPGEPTPRSVRAGAARRLGETAPGYGEAMGERLLRERIARHYGERYGVAVAPARVLVTTGSSGAFLLAFLAAFDAGARIGVATPGYPAYANILSALGLETAPIQAGADEGFELTARLVEETHALRPLDGLLIMSPANPTGAVIDAAELERICDFCAHAGITLVSDEIYHGLDDQRRAETALRFCDDAIVVNSFSKYWAMTGWRVGWLVAPPSLTRPLERLHQSLAICAPTLAQRAALDAFEAVGEIEAIRAGYARSRAFMVDRLPKIGLKRFAPPHGAFYIYADISDFSEDSISFCERLLREAGVATTPGVDFDPERGHAFVRLSYAGAFDDIVEGVERLGRWLQSL